MESLQSKMRAFEITQQPNETAFKAVYPASNTYRRKDVTSNTIPANFESYPRSVCMLVPSICVQPVDGQTYYNISGSLLVEDLAESFGVSSNEISQEIKFLNQKVVGFGTGFLVAPNIIATCAHVIQYITENNIDFKVIFNYTQETAEFVQPYQIYTYQRIFWPKEWPRSITRDFAFMRLDRKVDLDLDAAPLSFSSKIPRGGTNLWMLSHGCGLTQKISKGKMILGYTDYSQLLSHDMDSFLCDAGAPIFCNGYVVAVQKGRLPGSIGPDRWSGDFELRNGIVVECQYSINFHQTYGQLSYWMIDFFRPYGHIEAIITPSIEINEPENIYPSIVFENDYGTEVLEFAYENEKYSLMMQLNYPLLSYWKIYFLSNVQLEGTVYVCFGVHTRTKSTQCWKVLDMSNYTINEGPTYIFNEDTLAGKDKLGVINVDTV